MALALTGCHTEEYRNTISAKAAVAEQRVREGAAPAPKRSYNPLTVTDSIWGGGTAIRMRHGVPLPRRVESRRAVALISATPMSLRSIANAISAQTGIPVRLDKEADDGPDEDDALIASVRTAAPAAASKKSRRPVRSKSAARRNARPGMQIAYEGPLSGLLNRAASHFGVTWKYENGAVVISKYETRVFVIQSLPGTQKVSDGMREADSDSQSSSSSAQITTISQQAAQQTSSMEIDFKFWDEVGKTLEVILNGTGSYSLAPSSGTITVITTPSIMRTVADYIKQENSRLSRQVAINVEVYTVDINEGEDFNTSFDTALRRLTNFGANFTSPGAPSQVTTPSLGSLSIAVLNPETVGEITSMFDLLSTVGKTVRVAAFPMTTLNNRPVSRRVGQDRTYLASVQTNTSQTFQNTTLTPGIIRDGFSIQVTPRIMENGNVLLQYSLSLIDILEISSFSSGDNQIQLPRTASRIFVQQSMLRSGSTLVLAGYDQDQITQNSAGIGNPYNYLLGGGVGNSRVRQILFLAMTPQEISLPRTEND